MLRIPKLAKKEWMVLAAFAGVTALVVMLFFILQLIREGFPQANAPLNQAEVAVLIPFEGQQAEMGQAVLNATIKAVTTYPDDIQLQNIEKISVVSYDTKGTADGAAVAAEKAARNPATMFVVGLLDARQAQAAAEVLVDNQLAVITPTNSASVSDLSGVTNLYRIMTPDYYQSEAIVDFLLDQQLSSIYLIAEPSTYVKSNLDYFNVVANDRLKIVGGVDLSQQELPNDLAFQLLESEAQAVVFFGGSAAASTVIEKMNTGEQELVFIGCDLLDDPGLVIPQEGKVSVYYTSSSLRLGGLEEEEKLSFYEAALGDSASQPFAYETSQAVWFALEALEKRAEQQTPREAVWRNLSRSNIRGYQEHQYSLSNHLRYPYEIFIYQAGLGQDWMSNSLVYTYQGR